MDRDRLVAESGIDADGESMIFAALSP